jgi:hypothetical protein
MMGAHKALCLPQCFLFYTNQHPNQEEIHIVTLRHWCHSHKGVVMFYQYQSMDSLLVS